MAQAQTNATGSVVVSGGTGLVGRNLLPGLAEHFSTIRVLTRGRASTLGQVERVHWNGVDPGSEVVKGAAAVVHLAGEPIFGGLPTAARRARIRTSRLASTRAFVDAMSALDAADRPQSFVCASAVGFYGDRGEERLAEDARGGSGFLAEVCRDWEAAAERAAGLGVRVVRLRIGVVLSNQGGALALMRTPFSLGLGGRLGSGQQFFPWIHLEDLVAVILWALEAPVEGVVNAVAPEAVRNIELTRALSRVLRRPAVIPVPGFVLRLLLGEIAGELLGSRRVYPARLEAEGFTYRHPSLEAALAMELA